MEQKTHLLIFSLDENRYALPLESVERVIRLVKVTPITDAPAIFLGLLNMGGKYIAVIDMRKRFHLPPKEPDLDDQIIIVQTLKRKVAFLVDKVIRVCEWDHSKTVEAETILPGLGEFVKKVTCLEDEMILVYDLDKVLSFEEEKHLDEAIPAENEVVKNK